MTNPPLVKLHVFKKTSFNMSDKMWRVHLLGSHDLTQPRPKASIDSCGRAD